MQMVGCAVRTDGSTLKYDSRGGRCAQRTLQLPQTKNKKPQRLCGEFLTHRTHEKRYFLPPPAWKPAGA